MGSRASQPSGQTVLLDYFPMISPFLFLSVSLLPPLLLFFFFLLLLFFLVWHGYFPADS